MLRREFIRMMAMAAPAAGIGRAALFAQLATAPAWRTYEVTTSIKLLKSSGRARIWLPVPLDESTPFQKVLSSSIQAEGATTKIHHEKQSGLKLLAAEFAENKPAVLTTTHRIATRDWSVQLAQLGQLDAPAPRVHLAADLAANPAASHQAAEFLKPTRYVPTDGIVKKTSDDITRGATRDLDKVHAIYEWIVLNTTRDPKVRGCGKGDIRPMLELGDLTGKCADLNALFTGLVKASGVPARDVYGLRIGPSNLECRSLGTSSNRVEKAQHCRAEVYLTGFGWVPMDPADVRKVILEEPPGNLPLTDTKVQNARKRLFGSWEMNWMAYNYAQDVALPGSRGPSLSFLMYPQAETTEGRLDSLDPENFHYEITSHEVTG